MVDIPLDISGIVLRPGFTATDYRYKGDAVVWTWRKLSPFAQEYVRRGLEEFLASLSRVEVAIWRDPSHHPERVGKIPGFATLAPATLAAMLADCAEDLEIGRRLGGLEDRTSAKAGQKFWEERQSGNLFDWPPIALYLGEDGLIHQRERA